MANKSGKGGDYERSFSKFISKWWTNGERDDVFWRSSQSGGRATQRRKQGKDTAGSYGDITALDSIGEPLTGQFIIELKKGYTQSVNLYNILTKPEKNLVVRWIDKVSEEAITAGIPSWLLIVKPDYKEPILFLPSRTLSLLEHFHGGYPRDCFDISSNELPDCTVLVMKDFFNWLTPETIKQLWETNRGA